MKEEYYKEFSANKDIKIVYKFSSKKIKEYASDYKNHLKAKDYKLARKDIDKIKYLIDQTKQDINKIDIDNADILIGASTEFLKNCVKILPLLFTNTAVWYANTKMMDNNMPKSKEDKTYVVGNKAIDVGKGEKPDYYKIRNVGSEKGLKIDAKKYRDLKGNAVNIGKEVAIFAASDLLFGEILVLGKKILKGEKITKGDLNPYKNKVLDLISKLEKNSDKMLEKLNKIERNEVKMENTFNAAEVLDDIENSIALESSINDPGDPEDSDFGTSLGGENLSILESIDDTIDDYYTDVLTEGVNTDNANMIKRLKVDYKILDAQFKKAMKDHDYDKARRINKKISDNVSDIIDEIRNTKGDVGSAFVGTIIHVLLFAARNALLGFTVGIATGAATRGNIDTSVKNAKFVQSIHAIGSLINDLVKFGENYKKGDAGSFNLYRNELIGFAQKLKKSIDAREKDINTAEKMYEAEKEFKKDKKEDKKKDVKESLNDIINYYNVVIEAYDDILEDSDNEEEFTEGANLEVRDMLKKAKAEFKVYSKDWKKAMKNHEFANAKKINKKLLAIISSIVDDMEKNEGDLGSAYFGNIAYFFIFTLKQLIITMPLAVIGGATGSLPVVIAGYITSYAHSITEFIKEIKMLINNWNSKKIDSINLYKNELLKSAKKLKKCIEKRDELTDKAEKAYKEQLKKKADKEKAAVKESVENSFKTAVAALYESCNKGDISINQRESLINDLRNKMMVDTVIGESEIDDEDFDANSAKVKFEAVKKVIYNRCAAGEFNEDTREVLIDKAHKHFFPVTETDEVAKDDTTSKDVEKAVSDTLKASTAKQDANKVMNDVNKATKVESADVTESADSKKK